MSDDLKKYGLIESQPLPDDYILGSENPVKKVILQENRNWRQFLPLKELQTKNFRTFACVTFSYLNCLEIYAKRVQKETINKSDRFTATMSGTIPGVGNYLNKVAQSGRKDGLVDENIWAWTPDLKTDKDYYSAIPDGVKVLGLDWRKKWEPQYEWVFHSGMYTPDQLWDALKYSPLQVTVHTWGKLVNNIYQRPDTIDTNHAVTLFQGEYGKCWYIYDHFEKDMKTLSWDYYFGSSMKHTLKEINSMLDVIKGDQSTKVFVVGKDGKKHHIYNEATFAMGRDMGIWANWSDVQGKPQAEVDSIPEGNMITFSI